MERMDEQMSLLLQEVSGRPSGQQQHQMRPAAPTHPPPPPVQAERQQRRRRNPAASRGVRKVAQVHIDMQQGIAHSREGVMNAALRDNMPAAATATQWQHGERNFAPKAGSASSRGLGSKPKARAAAKTRKRQPRSRPASRQQTRQQQRQPRTANAYIDVDAYAAVDSNEASGSLGMPPPPVEASTASFASSTLRRRERAQRYMSAAATRARAEAGTRTTSPHHGQRDTTSAELSPWQDDSAAAGPSMFGASVGEGGDEGAPAQSTGVGATDSREVRLSLMWQGMLPISCMC